MIPTFVKVIKVGPESLELRPNFACYTAIEEKADCGLMRIVTDFSKGDIRMKYIAAVIYGGLVGTAKELGSPMTRTYEEVGDFLIAHGWAKHSREIQEFLSKCIVGYAQAVPEEAKDAEERQKKVPRKAPKEVNP